jgi:molecular chaperone HtpG
MTETFAFQAEINQLLSLIINTFYSNKDIFLRELISNGSDAIDKAKYEDPELRDYVIRISCDDETKELTIEDNGVGMTKDDLVRCLGTIANSGTKQFMQKMQEDTEQSGNNKASLIGQFGVGFYAAYLVADHVKVYSKHKDSERIQCWESNASGSFTIAECEPDHPDLSHGTRIVLRMKEDCLHYLEERTIKSIVKTHSDYINYPIELLVKRTRTKEVEVEVEPEGNVEDVTEPEGNVEDVTEPEGNVQDDEGNVQDDEGNVEDDEGNVEEDGETEKKPKTETVTEEYHEWTRINTQTPLWTRSADEVTPEEYATFYKSITNDWNDHLAVKHFHVEGQVDFKSVLFVPKRAQNPNIQKNATNRIKLYVKRVFVSDKFSDNEMVPEWLRFVCGVVDSEDLPLNVSREMLQQNKIMKVISKNVVKKCIEMFQDMANDDEHPETYKTFYEAFHKNIKLGIHEDGTNRDKLIKLLRFPTHQSSDPLSLEAYVDRMPEEQKDIYFITGESRAAVEHSPFVKSFKDKGFDVLLMTDPMDEYMMQQIRTFREKKLVNVTKHNATFHESNEDFDNHLCKTIKKVLDGIDKVVVSTRLTEDPCCLVSSEYGWTANMERIMKAQAMHSTQAMVASGKKIMEINPNHTMIKQLQDGVKNHTMGETVVADVVRLMFDTALLSSGYSHEDPNAFSKRIYKMISLGMNGGEDPVDDIEDPIVGTEPSEVTESSEVTEPSEVTDDMEEVD